MVLLDPHGARTGLHHLQHSLHIPGFLVQPCTNGGCSAKRRVVPDEVVLCEVEGQGVAVVLDLLREGVSLPRVPSHYHPHAPVYPLSQGGADEPLDGRA